MNKEKQIEEMAELERLLRIRRMDIEKQGCDIWALIKKTESEEQSIANYLIGQGYRKASEVVRCKDCVFFERIENGNIGSIKCRNTYGMLICTENDYCSYGKRKYTEREKNNGD